MANTLKPSMQAIGGCCYLLFSIFLLPRSALAVSDIEASLLVQRQLLVHVDTTITAEEPDPNLKFDNDRLSKAYIALQAWKKAIYSDPKNVTGNWVGPDVCSYTGVFCAPALDDPSCLTVGGIDLNEADIAGYLPKELEHLCDVALFHLNTNRFCGVVPSSLDKIKAMHEFDISNNRFVGPFPSVALTWPDLKFLDIRFNEFDGVIPPELFERNLDAVFLNNNRFFGAMPDTIGNSSVSVVTFANNGFTGCIPSSIACMPNVNEFVFKGNNIGGCFPQDLGSLANITLFDVSDNDLAGEVTASIQALQQVEQIDISNNKLTGCLPEEICKLPMLMNLTVSGNYLVDIPATCRSRKELVIVDSWNCLGGMPNQRTAEECEAANKQRLDCRGAVCSGGVEHQNNSPLPVLDNEDFLAPLPSPLS